VKLLFFQATNLTMGQICMTQAKSRELLLGVIGSWFQWERIFSQNKSFTNQSHQLKYQITNPSSLITLSK